MGSMCSNETVGLKSKEFTTALIAEVHCYTASSCLLLRLRLMRSTGCPAYLDGPALLPPLHQVLHLIRSMCCQRCTCSTPQHCLCAQRQLCQPHADAPFALSVLHHALALTSSSSRAISAACCLPMLLMGRSWSRT